MFTNPTTTTAKLAFCFKSTEKYSLRKAYIEVSLKTDAGRTKQVITEHGIVPTASENVVLLSISGAYHLHGGTRGDIDGGGQCQDTFSEELAADNIDFSRSDLTREQLTHLLDVWNEWHLNDLTTGTPAQTAAIKEWQAAGNKYDYSKACDYLATKGLLVDASMANHEYGHAWLTRPLPTEVQDFIKSLAN